MLKRRFLPRYSIHLARLHGVSPSRDPYIAALLIAAAQAQRKATGRRPASPLQTEQSFQATDLAGATQVRLLLSDVQDTSVLRVFIADIPEAFLDKLARPRQRPRPTSVQVRATTVPYEPYPTFQQRLLHVLFPRGRKRSREEKDH
ncbi:hypothetical protein Ct61P_15146 [Colletotrichum tofieldiae]|nr:hypothetical protein Ct61P_15146 [Colletotrichum tofieldiae]